MFFCNIHNLRPTFSAIVLILGITFGSAIHAPAQENSLQPKHFALDNRYNGKEVLFVINNQLYFSFDVPVDIKQGATASIVCEGSIVATGLLKAYNIEYGESRCGYVEAIFNSLSLPKGKDYTFVIDAGEIYEQGNPTYTNAELRRSFHVPEHIRMISSTPKDGDTLNKLDNVYITLSAIQDYAYSFKPQLYKGSEITDNKHFSYAYFYAEDMLSLQFYNAYAPETMPTLEEGVEYTIVIPEGSMKGSETNYRDDISNEEMRIHIKGGSSTGIHTDPTAEAPTIRCNGRTLEIDNVDGQRIRIHTLDGRTLHNLTCKQSPQSLSLPTPGVYIVNIGSQCNKIVVK